MTTQVTSFSTMDQNPAQAAISGPLSSRALFWRPRYIAETPFAYHLPFTFWLTDMARPTRVMAVGMVDGQSYFAVCQALDKLNISAMCTGFGEWGSVADDADGVIRKVPEALVAQNRDHYDDFSKIRPRTATAALKPVEDHTLDLLIVNLAADLGDCDLFFDLALRKLSERGIILIHDLQASHDDAHKAAALDLQRQAHQTIRFGDDDDGVLVLLVGNQQDDRLTHFADMKTGSAEFNTVQAVFHQLGAGHYYAWRSTEDLRAAEEAKALLAATTAERDALTDKYAKLTRAYEERNTRVATHQANLHDAQEKVSTLETQLTATTAALEALKEDHQALVQAHDHLQEKARTQPADSAEIRKLEQQLKTRFQELAILQREIVAVEKRAAAQVHALKTSTSWRITAPLRRLVLMLRARRK